MTGGIARAVQSQVATALHLGTGCKAVLVVAMLTSAAGVACHRTLPGVLPASIKHTRVQSLELKDGRVLEFDEAGALVSGDSIVGPVAGARTAVALRDLRQADVVAYDGTRTFFLGLGITLVVLVAGAALAFGSGSRIGGGAEPFRY